ncbi:MAG: hypothetical protein JW795_03745 [Chitinivibrionales bacterium]|nr:hypothetical protein [Chitinivibrionales bacterium]
MREKVLVAALNWGLGHAARCIPIINALERFGAEVVIASDGAPLAFLKQEFPHLTAIELPAYGIEYSRKLPMVLSISMQMPKILLTIAKEQSFLRAIQQREHFTTVISDSRFGCLIPGMKNIYVTHQVRIKFPSSMSVFENLGALFHKMVWNRFDAVWVIDRKEEMALSGVMGHDCADKKLTYIGIASRFTTVRPHEKTVDICFLLSGPEPQRTMFEKMILARNWSEQKNYYLIRGLVQTRDTLALPQNWTVANHLSSVLLQQVLVSSKKIVCRSGYSTIMDLVRLGLGATLVPTPGQPEQEYLAEHLQRKLGFIAYPQHAIDFNNLQDSENAGFKPYRESDDLTLLEAALKSVFKA